MYKIDQMIDVVSVGRLWSWIDERDLNTSHDEPHAHNRLPVPIGRS